MGIPVQDMARLQRKRSLRSRASRQTHKTLTVINVIILSGCCRAQQSLYTCNTSTNIYKAPSTSLFALRNKEKCIVMNNCHTAIPQLHCRTFTKDEFIKDEIRRQYCRYPESDIDIAERRSELHTFSLVTLEILHIQHG